MSFSSSTKRKRRDHRRLPLRGDEDEGDDAEKNSGQRERVSRALVRCPLKKNEETTRRFFWQRTIGGNDDDDDDKRAREHQYRGGEGGGGVQLTFNDLALPEHIVLGLQKCGFVYPSPVQVSAIPLERLGRDCLIQAKSGTGENGRVRVQTFLDSVLLTKGEA